MGERELSSEIKKALMNEGADLVGVADLRGLPFEVRDGFKFGIAVAIHYDKDVIRGIKDHPTPDYYDWYNKLNKFLDKIVNVGESLLVEKGYKAFGKARYRVPETEFRTTVLPHKTVARLAGLGWIGKCALLVTKQYGSAVRLSVILTDAPLHCDESFTESFCGICQVCRDTCPAEAIKGLTWEPGMEREEYLDAASCEKTAHELARQYIGVDETICGRCIGSCPWTTRWLNE